MKLFYYSNFTTIAWAKNPQHWREITGKSGNPLRCAHPDIAAPKGYHKPNGHLANDPIERIPTMRDLVNKL